MKKASDNVVEYIQNKIQLGEWRPGMRISTETQLKEATGYGKAAVREAVERLCALGMLSKHQGDGTYVNDFRLENVFEKLVPNLILDQMDLISILQFRKIVEPACVELFIKNVDEEKINELEESMNCMIQSDQEHDVESLHMADYNFHRIICEGSKNPIVIAIIKALNNIFIRYHYTAMHTIGKKTGIDEHKDIYRAIVSKDAELGKLLMQRHLERTMRDMQEYLKEQAYSLLAKRGVI